MKTNDEVFDVFPDLGSMAAAAARRFLQLSLEAVSRRGVFTVALSGGSTPAALYSLLAADPHLRLAIPWSKIHFFFGDERHVPPAGAESNFRLANEALFQHLPGETLNVHRIHGELAEAGGAAVAYEAEMREFFAAHHAVEEGFPRFDLIFLGMGADGHTASLFPDSEGLHETGRWVVANWVAKLKSDRVTLTFPVLNNAAEVILLVAGEEKAPVIARLVNHPEREPRFPVQWVAPRNGVKRWLLDRAAAPCFPPAA